MREDNQGAGAHAYGQGGHRFSHDKCHDESRRSLVWWAVLAVAVCGVVATAHGLYEVARGCGVETLVSGLYVPITDGLALVAYACTGRLRAGRWYAWLVVVLAAGLSGLAQAVNLAGLGEPPWLLRFGVGYWPAIAVAVAAHLLWLVRRADTAETVATEQVSVVATEPATTPAPPDATTDEPAELVAPVARPRPQLVASAAVPRRSQVTAYAGPPVPFGRREKGPCDCGCGGKRVAWDTWRRHHDPVARTAQSN